MIKNVSKYAYFFVIQECIIYFDFGVKFDSDMCLTVFSHQCDDSGHSYHWKIIFLISIFALFSNKDL